MAIGGTGITAEAALSQLVPDATLGSESSVVTPNVTVNEIPSDRIDGGAIRDGNLFHSFSEFNVEVGRGIYFSNPAAIERILTRVTGDNLSQILGTLGVLGNADLFLINPNGIIFGPNARLDLNGSFIGSSASSIIFNNNLEFSAANPERPPLLTINVPLGLQYGPQPGVIVNRSVASIIPESEAIDEIQQFPVGLQVRQGQTLGLVGGDLTLEGGFITATEGRVELGSVGNNSNVSLTPANESGWVLGYEGVQNFRDISLSQGAIVNSSGEGGGDIQVAGRRVTLGEDAQMFASTFGERGAGNLTVSASELVEMSGDLTTLDTSTYGTGAGGNLTVNTGNLIVTEGAFIQSSSFGEGSAGNLTVRALGSVELMGTTSDETLSSGLFAQVVSKGNGGNITIETERMIVGDGAQVSVATQGEGQAGNLIVSSSDSVELIGVGFNGMLASNISAQTAISDGDGGNIIIETGRLIIRDGALLNNGTGGDGRAGDLTVRASESVELIGTNPIAGVAGGIGTNVQPGAAGDGGDLTIETERLVVRGGGQIAASTAGAGNGGKLVVNAAESIELTGAAPDADLQFGSSGLFASSESLESLGLPPGTGDAGELTVTTGRLTVQDGARISADTFTTGRGGSLTLNVAELLIQNGGTVRSGSFAEGAGGNLTIDASDSVRVEGTGTLGGEPITSALSTQAEAGGNAGNLNVTAGELRVRNAGEVTVSGLGSGSAGSLTINADTVRLDNQGKLTANNQAGLGDITITTGEDLRLRGQSQISTNSQGDDPGGNITLTVTNLVASKNSDITANASNSFGGRVIINAEGVFGTQFREQATLESDITASSQLGAQFSGIVEINTPDVDPTAGLIEFSGTVVDIEGLIADDFCAKVFSGEASFTLRGRGGLPASPNDMPTSSTVRVSWIDPVDNVDSRSNRRDSNSVSGSNSSSPSRREIREATGWIKTPEGTVILTAEPLTAIISRPGLIHPACVRNLDKR